MKKPTNHKELMEFIDQISEVKEFMESFAVQMRDIILDRRIQLGWTQSELAQRVKQITGHSITQATISRIEGGTPGITAETYDKVLRTLGMKKISVEFEDVPELPDQEGGAKISTVNYVVSRGKFNL